MMQKPSDLPAVLGSGLAPERVGVSPIVCPADNALWKDVQDRANLCAFVVPVDLRQPWEETNPAALNMNGHDCERAEDLAGAEKCFRKQIEVLRADLKNKTADEASLARAFEDLGRVCERQGKLGDAEASYKEAVEINKRVLKPADVQTGFSMMRLADCLHLQGKHQEAEPLYEAYADVMEKSGDRFLIKESLLKLAFNHQAQGNEDKAQECLEKIRKIVPKGSIEETTVNAHLVLCLARQGKGKDADKLLDEVMKARDKGTNRELDSALVRTLLGMSEHCARKEAELDPNAKSIRYAYQAMDIAQRSFGNKSTEYADTLMQLASRLRVMGEEGVSQAPLMHDALKIYEKNLGEAHPTTMSTRRNYAFELYINSQFKEALDQYRKQGTHAEKSLGATHPAVADALMGQAWCLSELGQSDDAIAACKKEMKIRSQHKDKNTRHYISVLHRLAGYQSEAGLAADAAATTAELVKYSREKFGENSLRTADALMVHAKYLKEAGRDKEAQAAQDEATKIENLPENKGKNQLNQLNKAIQGIGIGIGAPKTN